MTGFDSWYPVPSCTQTLAGEWYHLLVGGIGSVLCINVGKNHPVEGKDEPINVQQVLFAKIVIQLNFLWKIHVGYGKFKAFS